MNLMMQILGLLISLLFIYIGVRFIFTPVKIIQSIQRMKYKTTAEPRQFEKRFSIIIGILLALVGIYYFIIVISSFLV